MQFDLLRSPRDLDLRSNFDLDLQGHAIHVSMRLDKANTWCQNNCSILSNTEGITEKLFRSKMPFLTFRDL